MTFIVSCQSKIKAKFEIHNATNVYIDSIQIESFDHRTNSKIISLEPNQTKTYWFDMTNLPMTDGDYLLSFNRKNTNKETRRFGYYSNGYPTEDWTKIRIEKDTLIIEPIFDKY